METLADLTEEYRRRFASQASYRSAVWKVLIDGFFQKLVGSGAAVLDLGAGWGEFIGQVQAPQKFAMDLNPDCCRYNPTGVSILLQDCSTPWALPAESLDVVFTSNFLEHLSDKDAVRRTLLQAYRALKVGGKIICIGPNIALLHGRYWDFWDHHVALTDLALAEILELCGFRVTVRLPAFLPYSMSQGWTPPVWMLRCYLRLPVVWPLIGKQFLVVAEKMETDTGGGAKGQLH